MEDRNDKEMFVLRHDDVPVPQPGITAFPRNSMTVEIHSDPLNAAVALKNVLEGLKEVELGRPLQGAPFYTGEMDEHGNYVESFAPWGIWSVKHENYEGTIEILLTRSEQGQPITRLAGCFKPGHQSAFLEIGKSVRERCKSHSIYWNGRNP